MNRRNFEDLSNLSMPELFRVEAENQTSILTSGLLELERSTPTPRQFETLMRAAHSLKGAARIINLQTAVELSHAMEDCFVAAQHGKLRLGRAQVDLLLKGVDLLIKLCKGATAPTAVQSPVEAEETTRYLETLRNLLSPVQAQPGAGKGFAGEREAPAAKKPKAEPATLPPAKADSREKNLEKP